MHVGPLAHTSGNRTLSLLAASAAGLVALFLVVTGWFAWQDTEDILERGVVTTGVVVDIDTFRGTPESIEVSYLADDLVMTR